VTFYCWITPATTLSVLFEMLNLVGAEITDHLDCWTPVIKENSLINVFGFTVEFKTISKLQILCFGRVLNGKTYVGMVLPDKSTT